jgi:hypothetical protein
MSAGSAQSSSHTGSPFPRFDCDMRTMKAASGKDKLQRNMGVTGAAAETGASGGGAVEGRWVVGWAVLGHRIEEREQRQPDQEAADMGLPGDGAGREA